MGRVGRALCALVLVCVASGSGLAQTAQQYRYDQRGRLIRIEFEDCSVVRFFYDLHGNRVQRWVVEGDGSCAGNQAPVAVDDDITLAPNGSLLVDLFAANGTTGAPDSDPDGDEIRVASISNSSSVDAVLQSDRQHVLITAPAAEGISSFNYTLEDPLGLTDNATVAVNVTTAINQPPSWTSGTASSAPDGQIGTNYTAQATDPENDPITYSIVGGPDQTKFSIDGTSGVLTFVLAPDHANPSDSGGDNVYNVTLRAVAGGLAAMPDLDVAITVTNSCVGAPSWTSGTTGSMAENTTATGYTASANPGSGCGPVSYSIVGGADDSLFDVGSSSGVLAFVSAPDYESPSDSGGNNVYNVRLRATAGSFYADRNVAITVTNSCDVAPAWTSGTSRNVAENSTATGYTAAANPGAGCGSVGYSIVGGADASTFSINSSSGVLSFNTAPDYESPSDSGGNNVYNVRLRATAGSLYSNRNVAITVTNSCDVAPSWTSGTSRNMAENSTATGYTATANPGAGCGSVGYSIVGGADANRFNINSSSGALTFDTAPDYENPSDSGGNNVYNVRLRATAGSQSSARNVTIAVIDEVENRRPEPVDRNGNVPAGGTRTWSISASDPDGDNVVIIHASAPRAANLSWSGLSLTYDAPATYGSDTVTVTVSDQQGAPNSTATSTVNVYVNGHPVIGADSYTIGVGETAVFNPLSNDTDPEGDSLFINGAGNANRGGQVEVINNKTRVRYTAGSMTGLARFSYVVSDGRAGADWDWVYVDVVNQSPTAVVDHIYISSGDTEYATVLANDSDPEGHSLSLQSINVTGTPPKGFASIQGNQIRFTANSNASGVQIVEYTIVDEYGATATSSARFHIENVGGGGGGGGGQEPLP